MTKNILHTYTYINKLCIFYSSQFLKIQECVCVCGAGRRAAVTLRPAAVSLNHFCVRRFPLPVSQVVKGHSGGCKKRQCNMWRHDLEVSVGSVQLHTAEKCRNLFLSLSDLNARTHARAHTRNEGLRKWRKRNYRQSRKKREAITDFKDIFDLS